VYRRRKDTVRATDQYGLRLLIMRRTAEGKEYAVTALSHSFESEDESSPGIHSAVVSIRFRLLDRLHSYRKYKNFY
jgi:hypothetical protein